MTRSARIWASPAISDSVMPSVKNSCAGSPDRSTSGSTAMDSIRGAVASARADPAEAMITRSSSASARAEGGRRPGSFSSARRIAASSRGERARASLRGGSGRAFTIAYIIAAGVWSAWGCRPVAIS